MSQFSLICVIEAGRLEAQTLMMLTTLKRFGGTLASSPIVAFQGRSGENISEATRKALADMDVEYVYRPDLNWAPWFNYTNKIAAVQYAQDTFRTPWIIWLDSDVFFLDEPMFAQAVPGDDVDFCARFEYLPPAVTDTNDTFAAYWRRVCEVCGEDFADVGFHDLDRPARRMKVFFNSGVFLWRRETEFAAIYARNFYRVLKARIGPRGMGPWIADQVSLTPTVATLDLRWKMLEIEDHLMMFPGALEEDDFLQVLPRARVVHYSKSRTAGDRERFDPLMFACRPELEEILRKYNAFGAQPEGGVISGLRKYIRRLRQEVFARTYEEF